MLEFLSYAFMQKAFFAGALMSVLCGVVGVFVVLRRLSFLADSIAHFSLFGIALGLYARIHILITTLFSALFASLGINYLREKHNIASDVSIGVFFPLGLSLGVLILFLSSAPSVDIVSYLFGSLVAISSIDILFLSVVFVLVLSIFLYLKNEFIHLTFSEESARADGLPVTILNYLFYALVAFVIVAALRVAGIMMVSALIIIPATIALNLRLSFTRTLLASAVISFVGTYLGIILSFYINAPTGVLIVLVLILLLFLQRVVHRE